MTLKATVNTYLDAEAGDTGIERAINGALAALIVLNVVAVILETVDGVYAPNAAAFRAFEAASVTVFGAEYLLRLWSCTEDPRYRGAVAGRVRYALSPVALVDLAAVLPSVVPGGALDLRFVRTVRLLRLLRSLKFIRYSRSLQTLVRVLHSRREELGVTAFLGTCLLVCAACGIYFAEHEAQPKAFSSIPASMWWGVVTLTTVGYGDVYPVTPLGKAIASVIAMLGIGLFALPAGIVASGFAEEVQRRRETRTDVCPHCGRDLREQAS